MDPGTKPIKIRASGFPADIKFIAVKKYFEKFGKLETFIHEKHLGCYRLTYSDPKVTETVIDQELLYNGVHLRVTWFPKRLKDTTASQIPEIPEMTNEDILAGVRNIPNFDNQVKALQEKLQEHNKKLEVIRGIIMDDISSMFVRYRRSKVSYFGSSITKLDYFSSDFDVHVANVLNPMDNEVLVLRQIRKQLFQSHKFSDILLISNARVPIIKCIHSKTGMCVDLNIQNEVCIHNSHLIRYYLSLDPKLHPLMLFIKYWLDVTGLKKVNFFSSYALCMMFIFYLQQEPYNLPSVHDLQKGVAPNVVKTWNCAFNETRDFSSPALKEATMKDLFEGFLKYYMKFDYFSLVVCPYLGRPLEKIDFIKPTHYPTEFKRYEPNIGLDVLKTFCVQDPIQHERNVTSSITPTTICKLVTIFQNTLDKLQRSADNFVHRSLLESKQITTTSTFEVDLGDLKSTESVESWESSFQAYVKKFVTEVMMCEITKTTTKKGSQGIMWNCQGFYDFLSERLQFKKTLITHLPPNASEFDLELATSAYIKKNSNPQAVLMRYSLHLSFPKAETKRAKCLLNVEKKLKMFPNVIQFFRLKVPDLFLSSQGVKLLDPDVIAKAVEASGPSIVKKQSQIEEETTVNSSNINNVKEEVSKEVIIKLDTSHGTGDPSEQLPISSKDISPEKEEKPIMVNNTIMTNTKSIPTQVQSSGNLDSDVQNNQDNLPSKESPSESPKEGLPLKEENERTEISDEGTRGVEEGSSGGDEKAQEEEDIPDDFFDDFANEDFMEGLDIVDAWDGEPGKQREEEAEEDEPGIILEASCSPAESMFSSNSIEKKMNMAAPSPKKFKDNKRKRSKSPIRWRKRSSPRDLRLKVAEKQRGIDTTPTRRDPEKTKRDIGRDKVKCAKDKEQRIVSDKLKLVETGLVPPGMELEMELPRVAQPRATKRSVEKNRDKRSPPTSRDSNERERKIRRRSNSREIKRPNLYSPPPIYRPRPRELDYIRIRRRSSSINSNNSSDRDWLRDSRPLRKRSRSKEAELRKKLRKYQEKEASKKKSFLEEIAEKLNEVRPAPVIAPHYTQIRPSFPNPVPAPVPAPSYYAPGMQQNSGVRMVQPPSQYDQQFFIGGDAYTVMQKNTMAYGGMMPPAGCVMTHAPQNQYPAPTSVVAPPPHQYIIPNIQVNIPEQLQQPKPSPKPPASSSAVQEVKLDTADVDKLFADKKISLSDFLTITAKPEVHSSTPEHLQKKIKVISRCQDAIKALSDDRRITGRLHVKTAQEETSIRADAKYQSPLRRIPIVRFQFTTPSKSSDEVDTFGVALDRVLHKLGILKNDDVIIIDPPTNNKALNSKSPFADEETLALTLKASQLSGGIAKKSPVKTISQSPLPCEECKLRRSKVFTEVSTQCEGTTKEMVTMSTQVTEEDLKPKTDSLASMTPAQLLGKSKEVEAKVEKISTPSDKKATLNPSNEQKQQIPVKAAASRSKPKRLEKPKPPGRGRGGRFEPFNRNAYQGGFGRGRPAPPTSNRYPADNEMMWNDNQSNYVDFRNNDYDEYYDNDYDRFGPRY